MGLSQYAIRELIGEKDNITIFEIGCADGGDTKRFLNTFGFLNRSQNHESI